MGRRKLAALQADVITAARRLTQDWSLLPLGECVPSLDAVDEAIRELDGYLEADISGHGEYVEGSPETSRNAALTIKPSSRNLRWRLLNEVYSSQKRYGIGVTDEQLESRLRGKHQTVSAARSALCDKGWLSDSGERRSNNTNRGAALWCLTDAGLARMEELIRAQV